MRIVLTVHGYCDGVSNRFPIILGSTLHHLQGPRLAIPICVPHASGTCADVGISQVDTPVTIHSHSIELAAALLPVDSADSPVLPRPGHYSKPNSDFRVFRPSVFIERNTWLILRVEHDGVVIRNHIRVQGNCLFFPGCAVPMRIPELRAGPGPKVHIRNVRTLLRIQCERARTDSLIHGHDEPTFYPAIPDSVLQRVTVEIG